MIAIVAAALLSAAACGGENAEPAASPSEASPDTPPSPACPDPLHAANAIGLILPTYDYQGTAAPAQLAGLGDLVVVGEVTEAGTASDGLWIELREATRVDGSELPDAEMRIIVDQMGTGTLEPDLVRGLQALAFLHENEGGALHVAIEGLWLSCTMDDPAAPAKLEPTGEGWPVTPTISGITELLVDRPQLVDGPVVRRSGMRPFEAIGMFNPEQLDHPDGVLALHDGCLSLVTDDKHTPLIWPPDTAWSEDDSVVHLEDGTTLTMGENLSPTGMHLPAFTVQYVIGNEAQMALDTCETVRADREAPVLAVKSLGPPSSTDAP